MQAFVKEIQRLNECKNYGRALYLLCNPPFKWKETCAEDRILLEVMRAQAHKKMWQHCSIYEDLLGHTGCKQTTTYGICCVNFATSWANYDTALS